MPEKARYWANPEHHRAEARNRVKRWTVLGVPWVKQLSPEAYERRKARQRNYAKAHLPQRRIAERRYSHKLKRLYGSSGAYAKWLNRMRRTEENAKKRKAEIRLMAPPQKLVKSF